MAFSNTGGLSASDEVQVNGIRKGQVRSMRLDGDRVIVRLELSRDVLITSDSRIAIRNVGLMGEKVIAVDLRATGAPYTARDTIQGSYEPGLGEAMGRIAETIDSVAELSAQLRELALTFQRDGRLQGTLRNFNQTSEQMRLVVSENRALLNETMRNLAATSRTAKSLTADREAQIRKALDDFASAAENLQRLSGRLDSLRTEIHTLAARLNSGQGTLGKLVQDDKLYDELNTSLASLRELIEVVKKNPKKYFHVSVF